MKLPEKIYLSGVPGCKWAGLAQVIETLDGMNITDRSPEREFFKAGRAWHTGGYYGPGMEAEAYPSEVHKLYTDPNAGCMLAKSHHWAYLLHWLKEQCQENGDWIMLVYRPDMASYSHWQQVGGFKKIDYPCYDWYEDDEKMFYEIQRQNKAMMKFACDNDLAWHSPKNRWIEETFGQKVDESLLKRWDDVLVTIYKP